jgi:hypothetical protein
MEAMPKSVNLTPADVVSFAGAYDLSETIREQIRAVLTESGATGVFTYEPALNEDDEYDEVLVAELDEVEDENFEAVEIEVYYWDIVYRLGEQEYRWQVEYDDEVNWWFEGVGQVEVDTLTAVLNFLLQHDRVELID